MEQKAGTVILVSFVLALLLTQTDAQFYHTQDDELGSYTLLQQLFRLQQQRNSMARERRGYRLRSHICRYCSLNPHVCDPHMACYPYHAGAKRTVSYPQPYLYGVPAR